MQKLFISLLSITFIATALTAQQDSADKKNKVSVLTQKNLVKVNFFALALKTVSVQYERVIGKKTTLALGVRLMPKGTLPFKNRFKDLIDSADTKEQVDNLKIGNFAITPEIRFYLSRKGIYHGFYIAPFVSFAHYIAELPYKYDDGGTKKTIPMSGTVNTITGGVMFGAQWQLGKSVFLDWWIFGPHYGSSNGSISGKQSLSPSEQASLRDDLKSFDDDVPLVKTTYIVDANGAALNFKGPWAGVRSGLCIGFRF